MNMRKLIILSLIVCLSASAVDAAMRKGPYLIYPGTNTKMQVLWQLDVTQTCTLEWGLNTSYSTGSTQTTQFGTDHQHKYTITGLTPSTKYYYRVTAGGSSYTGTFKAAPATSATNIKFFAFGDTRSKPAIFNAVAGGMISEYTSDSDLQTITLHSGDWAQFDTETEWTNHFFPRNQANILEFQANMPMVGCNGNHEQLCEMFHKYWPFVYAGGNYFSFDYGPAHICIVDTHKSGGLAPGTAQHTWLKNDLAATTKEWKFIILHAPGWSAGTHSAAVMVQNYVQPLCKTYGVDFVIAGHNHNYARCVVNGVYHITTGGGGAGLYSVNKNWPYVVVAESVNNYCTIDIQGTTLYYDAYRTNGTLIDSFTVSHGGGNPPTVADNPYPSDQATGVATDVDLIWDAGTGASSHDVYFGTASPGVFQGNQAGTTFDPGTMATSTTYYWRVDEVNANGTTTGPIWSFTTNGTGATVQSNPTDDSFVNQSNPTANFGSANYLKVRSGATGYARWPFLNFGSANYLKVRSGATGYARWPFLKFTVTGVSGTVTSAKLKIYSTDVTMSVDAKASNTDWTEGAITWNNKPTVGSTLDTKSPSASSWVEFDVASHVTGNGTYSFCLQGDTNSGQDFHSSEGTNKPVLIVTYDANDTTAPSAPTGLGATAGVAQVSLDWNNNTESDFSYYVVYRDTSSGGPYTEVAANLTTSAYTDTGLSNGTTYYYVVTAVDESENESSDSSEASATPQADITAPSAPTGLGATAGDTQVTLDWNNNSESDLAGYNVYRDTSTGGPYTLIATDVQASAYTDTGLTNDTTYYYVVTAVDIYDNESSDSSEASATPQASSSGSVESNPTDDSFVNQSNPTANFGNFGSANYLKVRSGATGYARWPFLKFTVTGVSGTVSSAKLKVYSTDVTMSVDAKASNTDWTEGAIIWNNKPTVGSTLDTKSPSAGSWVEFDVTSHVTGNGTYSFCLQGDTNSGQDFHSKEGTNKPVLIVTYGGDSTAPAAPANLVAVAGNTKVSLDWDDNTEEDIASYSVYRDTTSGGPYTKIASGVTVSDYNDTGLTNDTVYYYVVTAVDTSNNESADSNEALAMPEGVVKSIDFNPTDDAHVIQSSSTINTGTMTILKVRSGATSRARDVYLKFAVADINGTVVSAALKMYSESVTMAVTAKAVSNTSWTENSITWSNKPATGSTLDTQIPSANSWVEFDVSDSVTGNGTYSFCLQGNVNSGHDFTSEEATVNRPVLEVTYVE
ncbi:MAG: CBM96 family carbohydrate-binding protein [Planctomycetota bacterium]|jgi:fibronectin type 3 domain-containing protein